MNDFITEEEKNSLSAEKNLTQESPTPAPTQPKPAQFKTGTNEAFRGLGALEPYQRWSMFDVMKDEAQKGRATRLVTTIWNLHGSPDENGRHEAIYRDEHDGTYWYRVGKPIPGESNNWTAHWDNLELALNQGIPIKGILKDGASRNCSPDHTFDCGPARYEQDDKALWLQLKPGPFGIGCDVNTIDIHSITTDKTLGKEIEPKNTEVSKLMTNKTSLNQILFGPPGTGKTYATIDAALEIVDPEFLAKHPEVSGSDWKTQCARRDKLKQRYDALVKEGLIRFVTFHQSFSYEDFVEGLRAETNDENQLEYLVEPGIFKRLCDNARTQGVQPELGIRRDPIIWKISINGTGQNPTKTYCFNHGEARIGWGQTGDLRESYTPNDYYNDLSAKNQGTLKYFSEKIEKGDILVCIHSAETIAGVGVVTGEYYYEQNVPSEVDRKNYNHVLPVNWLYRDLQLPIDPLNDGKRFTQQTVYPLRLKWGDLLSHIEKFGVNPAVSGVVTDVHKPHVLIIDEINRGNISRIFGELITLIEPSKREGADEALKITLPYSKNPFSVPSNVYLIGTMNTADRSLAGLDIALRRRFTFKEMPPKPELLDDIVIEGGNDEVNIGQMLRKMNERIEVLLDRDHCLGHAYFMSLKKNKSMEKLSFIFRQQILPLLEEYFFEDWERIAWVLNDHKKTDGQKFLQKASSDPKSLFGDDFTGNVQDRRWHINEDAFGKIESYRGILGALE
ncbi:AAA family ATPase [Methylomicrobium lacus]|uniref:AAA family ATPase n=1 Tax=Methylomicrobium lacus TaxID=136992 RepID=UPI00045EC2C0|nr:AAA family ATPase [Methylomicrobium lacus]